MKQLIAHTDPESTPIWMTEMTDEGWSGRMAADTDITVNVPTGARLAIITADDHFFLAATAVTLPSVGVVTKTDAEMNKNQLFITTETEFHMRGRNAADFSASFWR